MVEVVGGGGGGCGGGGGGGGGDGGGGSSSSSSSSGIGGDSTLKSNISNVSISSNSSSCTFCALLNYFNTHFRLGTSVLIFRRPALPFGCEPYAAASELSVSVSWRDELPEGWKGCILQSGRSTKLLP